MKLTHSKAFQRPTTVSESRRRDFILHSLSRRIGRFMAASGTVWSDAELGPVPEVNGHEQFHDAKTASSSNIPLRPPNFWFNSPQITP